MLLIIIIYLLLISQTPLTTAAKNGDIACVKTLLANKCDLYLKGNFNGREKYAWEIANELGHTRIASYLNGCVGK